MNARTLVSAVALVAGLFAIEQSAAAKPGIVVLGLEVRDLEANIDEKTTKLATDLTAGLRGQAKAATSPYSLVPNAEAELTEVKVINMCDDAAVSCMSTIGKDMKADRLLYGSITKRKNGYQVSLDLLDVQKKKTERTDQRDHPVRRRQSGRRGPLGQDPVRQAHRHRRDRRHLADQRQRRHRRGVRQRQVESQAGQRHGAHPGAGRGLARSCGSRRLSAPPFARTALARAR